MAHGQFRPGGTARIGLTDRIFTRVGASDELSRGHSTFMVEMTEAANILNNATARAWSFSTRSAAAPAPTTASPWPGRSPSTCTTHARLPALFATHYHELAQLAETLAAAQLQRAGAGMEDEVIFLHKMAPGSADKSYGIHVAPRRRAGGGAGAGQRGAGRTGGTPGANIGAAGGEGPQGT